MVKNPIKRLRGRGPKSPNRTRTELEDEIKGTDKELRLIIAELQSVCDTREKTYAQYQHIFQEVQGLHDEIMPLEKERQASKRGEPRTDYLESRERDLIASNAKYREWREELAAKDAPIKARGDYLQARSKILLERMYELKREYENFPK